MEFQNMMRRLRKYVADVDRNTKDTMATVNALQAYKGSKYYDDKLKELEKKSKETQAQLLSGVKDDMVVAFDAMRRNVSNRIAKAPTGDQANALTVLSMLDSLTPAMVRAYADQMSECPLALSALSQIARKHNINVKAPDAENLKSICDVLENAVVGLLTGYNENGASSVIAKQFRQYLEPENIVSADRADRACWNSLVNYGSPDILDGGKADTKVEYFFADVTGLSQYIQQQTQGLDDKAKEAKQDEILKNCPDQYGAAYRQYLSTGEVVDLV